MPVNFETIDKGSEWDRKQLADLWGYESFHAIARGVFTPAGQHYIVLFVTEDKQAGLTQYSDLLEEGILSWEGEEGHRSDDRIANSDRSGDEIHLFYRQRHHSPFEYKGKFNLKTFRRRDQHPSEFTFEAR